MMKQLFHILCLMSLVVMLMTACGESHQQMVLQLEELERQNRADSLMLNDTLALRLADYFDRHGQKHPARLSPFPFIIALFPR